MIPWRPGRIDGFERHVTPDGRLPDAAQGADHLRNVSLYATDDHLVKNFILTDLCLDFLPYGVH